MKNDRKSKNDIIDEYFGEGTKTFTDGFENDGVKKEFIRKLNSSMQYMNSYDFDKIETDLNIEEVLALSEKIVEKRKQKKDIILFTVLGMVMLSLMFLLTFEFGAKFMLYFQIFICTNLPLLIIPVIYKSKRGGNIL